jgi:galactose-1-phosphate uridylyltransferase
VRVPRCLRAEDLAQILQAEHLETLTARDLLALTREELSAFLPDGEVQVDPRNGDRILYHSARGGRPHDNVPPADARLLERECAICQGQTTGVIDVARLTEGITFINKNLYPVLYPFQGADVAAGLHLLQWTSSYHHKDWHNMPLADCVVVMERLAALEEKLLEGCEALPAARGIDAQAGETCFVVIIKNYGRLVGSSLIHGHQQIALTNVAPRHFVDNLRFVKREGETFAAHMLRENPAPLLVRDYGPAVLVVPYFMRRPYDMILLVKDCRRRYLHQLDPRELKAVAQGWHDAIYGMRAVLPQVGREIAYNVITSNGPGAGLYFEFLPYTQEIGGVERLGLFVCQESPERAAANLRDLLGSQQRPEPSGSGSRTRPEELETSGWEEDTCTSGS